MTEAEIETAAQILAEARRTGTCTPGHPLPAKPGPVAAPR